MRMVPLVLSLALVVAACMSGASIVNFVDLPSLIVVAGLTTTGLFAAHRKPFSLIWNGLRGKAGPEELKQLEHIAQTGNRLSIGSGWVGFIIGATQMLIGVEDFSVIQPASAVLILTILYGHTLSVMFWIPLEQYSKSASRHE